MSNKLPIPRLRQEKQGISGRRTSRACDSCRQRKSKCDGQTPICSRCLAHGLAVCVYSDAKGIKKQALKLAQRKVEQYESLLHDILGELDESAAKKVTKVLSDSGGENSERPHSAPSSVSSLSSVGSLDGIDVVNEDLNRSEESRATGYMGKDSEITWMQRLESHTKTRHEGINPPGIPERYHLPFDASVSSINYRLDYQPMPTPDAKDAYSLPPRVLADLLFKIYLERVQLSLPFIREDLFMEQYQRFFEYRMNPGQKWLAILNMIFAIGCAYYRLSGTTMDHEADESLFLARARTLNISESVLYGSNDLQQVQAEALIGFYFLVISQINRSWKMIGIAARSGIALGLNLRSRANILDVKSEDARKQLWWSILRLENRLSIMTGRVSCLGVVPYSAPHSASLPMLDQSLEFGRPRHGNISNINQWTIHLNRKQSNSQRNLLMSQDPTSSLFSFYMVDLSLIAHAITTEIYAISTPRVGWNRVKDRTGYFNKKIDHWKLRLHPSFHFQDNDGNLLPDIRSFQLSLALSYYSICIILNRPCLNGHAPEGTAGAETRSRFKNKGALHCLRASLAVIALFPDHPNIIWYYEMPQWWDTLHILIQAIVILLLHLAIGELPMTSGEDEEPIESTDLVWSSVRKGLSWLHCLGATSEAARRALHFFNSCVDRIAPEKDLDVSDTSFVFRPSQTSHDPGFDLPQESLRQQKRKLREQRQGTQYGPTPDSTNSSEYSLAGNSHDRLPFHSLLVNTPGTSAVFEADMDMSQLSLPLDMNIEDVLLSMVNCNS